MTPSPSCKVSLYSLSSLISDTKNDLLILVLWSELDRILKWAYRNTTILISNTMNTTNSTNTSICSQYFLYWFMCKSWVCCWVSWLLKKYLWHNDMKSPECGNWITSFLLGAVLIKIKWDMFGDRNNNSQLSCAFQTYSCNFKAVLSEWLCLWF